MPGIQGVGARPGRTSDPDRLAGGIGQQKCGGRIASHTMELKGHGHHNTHIGQGQQTVADVVSGESAAVEYRFQPRQPDRDERPGQIR